MAETVRHLNHAMCGKDAEEAWYLGCVCAGMRCKHDALGMQFYFVDGHQRGPMELAGFNENNLRAVLLRSDVRTLSVSRRHMGVAVCCL